MLREKMIIAIWALFVTTAVQASTPWKSWEMKEDSQAIRVLQYLDADGGDQMVILGAGKKDGLVDGTSFKTFRSSANTDPEDPDASVWIETGVVKAVQVQEKFTIARVELTETSMSRTFFPQFPGVMAGDLAVARAINLVKNQKITPASELSYHKLFEDPKSQPSSFELSRQGVQKLREAARVYSGARLSLLMVEGYTDHKGPTAVNQVESYQRAMTVRQFLIDDMGFDPDRVLAIGYGESEQVDGKMAPGFEVANRRIVLKAVPVN